MPGTLYLIPTTLGSFDDADDQLLACVIPVEVQKITAQLDYFIAENAKTARAHLKFIARQFPLSVPLQQILVHELNVNTAASALPDLLAPLLAGRDGGLISEAGVPAVADPGANLIKLAHQHGIAVRPLVGPSSLLLAVMASGLNGQSFAFNGYLPVDAAVRTKRIKALEERSRLEGQTQLFIETPYRNLALLEALASNCREDTMITIASNLTTTEEIIKTQSAAHWVRDLTAQRIPAIHKKPTVFLFLAM